MARKVHAIKIEGSYYARPDRRWGGCAEELFHHTSRYYHYTEAFLRNLTGDRQFQLEGYQAERLSAVQRRVMAAVLSLPPGPATARAVMRIAESVRESRQDVDPELLETYRYWLRVVPLQRRYHPSHSFHEPLPPRHLPPLEPFLALAERLQIPVAVNGHYVEVSSKQLARHLDSTQHQVRENLQNAILWLHDAGYRIRNHPELTHQQARHCERNAAP